MFGYNAMTSGLDRGVTVTVVLNGHRDTSSNPGRGWLSEHRYEANYSLTPGKGK